MLKDKALLLFITLNFLHLETYQLKSSIHPLQTSFDTFEPVFIAELWRSGAKVPEDPLFSDEYPLGLEPGSLQPNGMRT